MRIATVNIAVLAGYRLLASRHQNPDFSPVPSGPTRCYAEGSLHPGTNDAEPLHAELKSGAVHPQSRRRATRSGDDPLGVFQGRENVLTFCFLHSPPLGANLAGRGAGLESLERHP